MAEKRSSGPGLHWHEVGDEAFGVRKEPLLDPELADLLRRGRGVFVRLGVPAIFDCGHGNFCLETGVPGCGTFRGERTRGATGGRSSGGVHSGTAGSGCSRSRPMRRGR